MARKEKVYNYIYKTTNTITGRYYIGMHSTDDLTDEYMGSGKRLRRSLNKHGKENHVVEILEFMCSRKELIEKEKEIVNLKEIAKKNCMNLMPGGEGGLCSEAHIEKLRKAASANMYKKWKENEFREMHCKLSAERMKQHHKNGKIKYDTFSGKKHSEITKELMSSLKKGTGMGQANSQFGTCWITKDGFNKKIKLLEFILFQEQGWQKGRDIKYTPIV